MRLHHVRYSLRAHCKVADFSRGQIRVPLHDARRADKHVAGLNRLEVDDCKRKLCFKEDLAPFRE